MWNLRMQKRKLNIEKITFKVAQIKFLAMHITSVETRLLGGLHKNKWGGGGHTHLSVFHSVSNRVHGKRSRNSSFCGSIHFQLFFFVSSKRL